MVYKRPVACCRVFVHVFHPIASATRAAQRRACGVRKRVGLVVSIFQCFKCRSCVPVVTVRTKEKRGGCVPRPTASESPETRANRAPKGTQTELIWHPSPRHAQFDRALAVGDGGMGGMDGGFCGAGLALALSLMGEGSVIWAVLIRSRRCGEREGRARDMYFSLIALFLSLVALGRNNWMTDDWTDCTATFRLEGKGPHEWSLSLTRPRSLFSFLPTLPPSIYLLFLFPCFPLLLRSSRWVPSETGVDWLIE